METAQDGSYYSWWPMPYAEDAKVELYNGSDEPIEAGDAAVTVSHDSRWAQALSPHGEAGRFHATSRRAHTTTGRDWVFLDTTGRGRFVGVSHTAAGDASTGNIRNYLEGDERVYVDGSRTPQIHGTGSEDFYEAGWYFNRGAFSDPTNGHAAEETREAGCAQQCDSAYRLTIGDAVAFGSGLRFGIEHGPGDDEPATYGSTAFSYQQPHFSLQRTDVLDVGDGASERAHGYSGGGDAAPWTLAGTFEGDDDGILQSDDGRASSAPVEFSLAVERANEGVRLRRLSDQEQPCQAGRVLVDGRAAGTWQQPLRNPHHRWLEDTFELPAALTADRRVLHIRLEPLAGAPAWQAARYEAFSRVKPYADHEAPARVTGLTATAGAGNAIRLSWQPAFDRTEVRYEVYGSRDADFALGPETLVGETTSTGFTHEGLGLSETWHYRVRAVDTSGNAGETSAPASATTGNTLTLEGESLLPAQQSSAPAVNQGNCCGVTWSNNAQIWFQADGAGDAFTVRFDVPQDGTYDLSAVYTQAIDYGITTLALDGETIGEPFDGYHAPNVVIAPPVDYGAVQLSAGEHTFTWTVTGRNAASRGFFAGVDVLRLELQE
jgi:hypothetical protein